MEKSRRTQISYSAQYISSTGEVGGGKNGTAHNHTTRHNIIKAVKHTISYKENLLEPQVFAVTVFEKHCTIISESLTLTICWFGSGTTKSSSTSFATCFLFVAFDILFGLKQDRRIARRSLNYLSYKMGENAHCSVYFHNQRAMLVIFYSFTSKLKKTLAIARDSLHMWAHSDAILITTCFQDSLGH